MKKILKIFLSLIFLTSFSLALSLNDCYKIYSKDADSLFMSALSAISSSNEFNVVEFQSKNGYILFLKGSKYYLLTLTKRYQNQTEIKVFPQNSDFATEDNVASTIFYLIDNELRLSPMEQIK